MQRRQWFGTKRPSLEQDLYETFDRENVTLVDLTRPGIDRFDERGTVTADGERREYHVVILSCFHDSSYVNVFMVYSPQAPTVLSNRPPIIEIQVNWIVDAISNMRDEVV